jgi:ubiquinol-cytochrome c reductase cytochrome b subunit
MMEAEYLKFPVPKSLNYFWSFGGIAMFCLIGLILSGIFLGMHYKPSAEEAFNSVERIMRDVQFGWLVRYLHMNLASFFFIAVYIHIFRALYFGSYKAPRELVFIFGMLMFFLMMGTAFLGYTLPWGQMSYWGATVITNLFSAIPIVGDAILITLLGDFTVGDATVNRFYVLHWLLAFAIVGLVVFHVITLHMTGSNNPTGMEPQSWDETLSFHPYMTIKDTKAMVLFFILVAFILFFYPNIMGHSDNYIRANSMVTPAHIVPEWYFLPFYAILRAIPDKLGGVLAMFGSIALVGLLPWLDTSKVRSCLYRPIWRICVLLFALDFFLLTYMGGKPAEGIYVLISRIGTAYWFLFFLVLAPLVGYLETPRQPLTISNFIIYKKALS